MDDNKTVIKKNGINKQIEVNTLQWQSNITVIDISNRNIVNLDDNMKLPLNLKELNLSHNKLVEVPCLVLLLENLKRLDLSFNEIKYFDDTPNFCHTIQCLNLHNNALFGPPYWVWSESPRNLKVLKLSCNINITNSFVDGYLEELMKYTTLVSKVDMFNCRLGKNAKLLATFSKAKELNLGISDYSYYSANNLQEVPCIGLENCCDIERLNLCNTHVHTINSTIDIFKNLIEINLSYNNIYSLPIEFCLLENLEICILSSNKLLYLPEDMYKLKKLISLQLDNNELCMIPDSLFQLGDLKILDLYDNHLCEIPSNTGVIQEIDLALNYFDEPEDAQYVDRKRRIRLLHTDRYNGRKVEFTHSESEHTPDSTDDELQALNSEETEELPKPNNVPSSSPEDWDSDEYWIPRHYNRDPSRQPHSPWFYFVKRKMEEGNFCPMDAHPVSVAEKVKYEKMCNPQEYYESDGQFDDFSGDDS